MIVFEIWMSTLARIDELVSVASLWETNMMQRVGTSLVMK